MTGKHFLDLFEAQPFQPFTIRLADGQAIEVPHPEMTTVSETGRIVTVREGDGSYHYVDLLLAIALEVPPPRFSAATFEQ